MSNAQKKAGVKREMGKIGLWNFFRKSSKIRPYLPATSRLTLTTTRNYLSRYGLVYIKPNFGQNGRGIIKVWHTKNGYAYIVNKGKSHHCKTVNQLYKGVKSAKTQVIQRGIVLPKIKGHQFDIRLLMVRDVNLKWKYGGMIARLAGNGWVITNKRSHGQVLTVDEALKRSLGFSDKKIKVIKRQLIQLGYQTCSRFNAYKSYRQIGIDLAVDVNGRIWVIEENTGPGWSMFKKLPDKTMYRRINTLVRSRKEKWSY